MREKVAVTAPATAVATPIPKPMLGAIAITLMRPAMLSSSFAPVSNQINGQYIVVTFSNKLGR